MSHCILNPALTREILSQDITLEHATDVDVFSSLCQISFQTENSRHVPNHIQ